MLAYGTPNGVYFRAVPVPVSVPAKGIPEYSELQGDVARVDARKCAILSEAVERERELTGIRMSGPNDPCWCGNGKKYKNCHRGLTARRIIKRSRSGYVSSPLPLQSTFWPNVR